MYTIAPGSGTGVAAAGGFPEASLRAQFAVAGAPDETPADGRDAGSDAGQPAPEGGTNVVEGVPDDVDHVVDLSAVAFEPAELTVSQGDSVAWRYATGEPHSESAYQDEIPGDAEYRASGGFESEETAGMVGSVTVG